MQYPPKLIGLHGLKGSGKDLSAAMIRKYASNSRCFAFADKLKRMCSVAWSVPLESFYSVALKEEVIPRVGLSPREMMTSMQDVIKARYGEDFFVGEVVGAWEAALRARDSLLVTDLRFHVELQRLREIGAVVVHIGREDKALYRPSTHVSEAGLSGTRWDYVIHNHGDKNYLLRQIRGLVCSIWGEDSLKAYPFIPEEIVEF